MKNHGLIKLDATIIESAAVVGKKEYEGPIGSFFDLHDPTDAFGKKTWEKAESEMQRLALSTVLGKAGLSERDIDGLFAGDLLNQCIGSSYGLMDFDIPYFGLYGACSTAVEGLLLGSVFVTHGIFERCASVSSSHNCSAERQFRSPIEYGSQKPPTAQWTVTGSGAFIIGNGGGVRVSEAMAGIVVERGIKDANNMGAAMAPAAASTLLRYNNEVGLDTVDIIVTGDLGYEGGDILCELMLTEGVDIRARYNDCGMIIYDKETQGTLSGGSGCGCSASVLASYFVPKLRSGEIGSMLILGTGAMMSPDSIKQGEVIPAVAHLVRLESGGK